MSLPPGQYILAIGTAVVVVGCVIELLRRRQLREKYAVLWLLVGIAVSVISLYPQALEWAAGRAAIKVPVNLLFFLAILLLLGVTMHLSWESSRQEERSRLLAEEVALLHSRVERVELRGSLPPTPREPRPSATLSRQEAASGQPGEHG